MAKSKLTLDSYLVSIAGQPEPATMQALKT